MLDFSDFFQKGTWPSVPLKGNGFFISGARACGKTSFAFQTALNCVLHGGTAVMVCSSTSMQAKLPKPFTRLDDVPSEVLDRIQFMFVENWVGAAKELMDHFTNESVPSVILVDDDGFDDGVDASAPNRTGPSLGSPSLVLCLSCLENIKDWFARNHLPFFYVVVSNTAYADHMRRLPLPLGAFPVVHIWMGASGTVQVTPVAAENSVVEVFSLRWNDGLCLM